MKIRIACMVPVLFLLTTVHAQVTRRNILQSYTNELSAALLSQAGWKPFPQTAEEWHQDVADSVVQGVIREGEGLLQYEFKPIPATLALEFVRTGNRIRYERASFEKRNALCGLMLAEAVEGKGRFLDKILDGIWSICEETYWGLPAHLFLQKAGPGLPDIEEPSVDLFTAETAAVLAWTDYFLGTALSKISPLVRPRIYYEVNRRVFMPLSTAKYEYLGGGKEDEKLNNWAPWVMSNYLAAVLVLEKDGGKRLDAAARAIHYTDLYLNGLGEDGGCDEGPAYWSQAGGAVLDVLNILYSATGGKINGFQKPLIKKMASYIYKTHIAGIYYVNVADSPPQLIPDGHLLYRAGKIMGDTVMMQFGSWVAHTYPGGWRAAVNQFCRTRTLFDMMTEKECRAYPSELPVVKDSWFGDVELMASRNARGLFVASHGGHNAESHNHNDVGDVIVYAGGQPVLMDVGSGTYTARTFFSHRYDLWFNNSSYHNLPAINGIQQKDGQQYAASNVHYEQGKGGSSLTMDIAGAYPAEAGLRTWVRTVRMTTAAVRISDRYTMSKPLEQLTQSFITVCRVDVSQRGKVIFETDAHEKVVLDYDAAIWEATAAPVPLTQPEDEGVQDHWKGKVISRVLLKAVRLASSGKLEYTIHY